jgi:nanoRNase/pAp phosphatase (c-di-AMP/oligoRNAs hydrolase)
MSKKTENSEIYVERFTKLITEKTKRAALFSHAYPDPDSLGSCLAVQWLLYKMYGIESDIFYDGTISHPQNLAMVNLLDIALKPSKDYCVDDYQFVMLLDTIPANAGAGGNKVEFDAVIDHHKENPTGYSGTYINLKAGSCCATIFDLISNLGVSFEKDNDLDARVATSLLVGIANDTEMLMSDDTTEYEFKAWSNLFDFRNPVVMKQIINFKRPTFWVDSKAKAIMDVVIHEGVGVVGMGIIPSKHRDMIADMASEMVTWEDVHTAVAFAMIDGERIEGSVRSTNASISVPALCKELAEKYRGDGGGKLGKGAYRYGLGGAGVDEDDDEETKEATWKLFNEKEKKRIFHKIRK